MDRNVEMFMNVEKVLIQNKCLSMPVVYIRSDLDKTVVSKVKDIVKRHQGTICGKFYCTVVHFILDYIKLFFECIVFHLKW